MRNILEKIDSTETELSENSDFYAKFKNSTIFEDLSESANTFVMSFNLLWANIDEELEDIDSFISGLSGQIE